MGHRHQGDTEKQMLSKCRADAEQTQMQTVTRFRGRYRDLETEQTQTLSRLQIQKLRGCRHRAIRSVSAGDSPVLEDSGGHAVISQYRLFPDAVVLHWGCCFGARGSWHCCTGGAASQ